MTARTLTLLALLLTAATTTAQSLPQPDVEATETARTTRADVAGVWRYDKPAVQAQGTNWVGTLGKPIAKSKLKKKLDKAFKKLKINKRWQSLTLTPDGEWVMAIGGLNTGGKYDYDPTAGKLTLRWHGLPLSATARRDGKHLHLLFDSDRLLTVLGWIGGLSHSDTLKAVSFLTDNYRDVMVGFDLKPQ